VAVALLKKDMARARKSLERAEELDPSSVETVSVAIAFELTQGNPAGARSRLEARLKQAVRQYAQAGRAAGLSGTDTTSDAESARVEIQQIQKRLDEIGRKSSAEVKEKLAKVKAELEDAKQGMGIR